MRPAWSWCCRPTGSYRKEGQPGQPQPLSTMRTFRWMPSSATPGSRGTSWEYSPTCGPWPWKPEAFFFSSVGNRVQA